MDLQEAQAKIKELEQSEAQAKQAAIDAKAEADAAKNELHEAQAANRQTAIDKLAADNNREFTEAQVNAFKAMDEAGFQAAASLVTPQAPKLPDGLDQEQATSGRQGAEGLDAKFNEWSKDNA